MASGERYAGPLQSRRVPPERLVGLVAELRSDAVAAIRWLFKVDLWDGAIRMIRAVERPHARVAVQGAHATAKTHTAGAIALQWLYTGGVVVTTASRFDQSRLGVWREMHKLLNSARVPLGLVPLRTEINLPGGALAVAWSTRDELRFQGMHAERLLYVVDEGVDPGIYRAIDGARASGDVRELHLGNPRVPSGPYYDLCSGRVPGVTRIRLSAFDSPNLVDVRYEAGGVTGPGRVRELEAIPEEELDKLPRPYLAGPRFVREIAARYGVKSGIMRWKVFGDFPQQTEDALVLREWIEAAVARPQVVSDSEEREVGIDVAGPGEDEHVVVVRRGNVVESITAWRGAELAGDSADKREVLASRTIGLIRELRPGPSVVKVDDIGEGAHLVTVLRAALPGIQVRGVNVARSCAADRDRERYANEKARLFWLLRERFQSGRISIPHDETLEEQAASVGYREVRGQVVIETKEQLRARGVGSPDRFEALMLAFADERGQAIAGAFLL